MASRRSHGIGAGQGVRLRTRVVRGGAVGVLLIALLPAAAAAAPRVPAPATEPAPAVVAPSPGDWPHTRGDAAHTANNSAETRISTSTVDQLQLIWHSYNLGSQMVAPTVADGTVYVGNATRAYGFATDCGTDGEACLSTWTQTLSGLFFSAITIAGGVAYVPTWGGYLYAFAEGCSGSCDPIWYGESHTFSNIGAAPTVANGVVYVADSAGYLRAFAVGCATGNTLCSPLWEANLGAAAYSSPAVAGGRVFIGSTDHHLYAFAEGCATGGATCTPVWTADTGAEIRTSPTVYNGMVYVGLDDGSLRAYSATCSGTCPQSWQAGLGGVPGSPAAANGVIYVGAGDGMLYAFNANGSSCPGGVCSPLWTGVMPATQASGSAVVANGVVFIGAANGHEYAFDAAGSVGCDGAGHCRPIWSGNVGGAASTAAVANGMLYVAGSNTDTSTYTLSAFGLTGDWSQFHDSRSHAGNNALEDVLGPDTIQALKPAWMGHGATAGSRSSPVVSNGWVYYASDDGHVYAYRDACAFRGGSCGVFWHGDTGGGVTATPAVADGVLYVASTDGLLYAFDADCHSDGSACAPTWTADTGAPISSSPTVADGHVFVGSNSHRLYSFPTSCTGSPCAYDWYKDLGVNMTTSPAVYGGWVYVVAGSTLEAFPENCNTGGASCGLAEWTADLGATGTSPTVAGGVVYVGTADGHVLAYDAAGVTGCTSAVCSALWQASIGSAVQSTPAVANGRVYVGANDNYLHAFAVGCGSGGGTCTEVWKGGTTGAIVSSPAVANGLVFVGSEDNGLYAFRVGCGTGGATCQPAWSYALSSFVESSPAISHGSVYASDGAGLLWAFKLEAGLNDLATRFHPIDPARILDTRDPTSQLTGYFTNGIVREFQVVGQATVGLTPTVPIPGDAMAVTGNLTVTEQNSSGVIALAASMTKSGKVTTLNYVPGDNRANNVTIGLSPTGKLQAVLRASSGSARAHLVFDLTGYFTADGTGSTFHPTTPGRVLDTRRSSGGIVNIGLAGKSRHGVVRTVQVSSVAGLGWGGSSLVPDSATGVTGNVTITNATTDGYVTLGPTVASLPSTSTLNVKRNVNRANGVAVATLTRDGKQTIQVLWHGLNSSSTADVIFDVTGYFTDDTTGLQYHPIVPVRYLDSVGGIGLSGHFTSRIARTLTVGYGQVPSTAQAISGNLTLFGGTTDGYGQIAPTIVGIPTSSTVNTPRGVPAANGFNVSIGSGKLDVFFAGLTASARGDFYLDITGFWN